jgi:hypothetical protein
VRFGRSSVLGDQISFVIPEFAAVFPWGRGVKISHLAGRFMEAVMETATIETRRRLLSTLAGVVVGALAVPRTLRAQSHPTPQPMQSPNAPANQNAPVGLDGDQLVHQPKQSTISPLMWTAIKSDSEKLLMMATDLKAKIDQTNLSATLSLPLIKEAHEIEKMAKGLQSRMRS